MALNPSNSSRLEELALMGLKTKLLITVNLLGYSDLMLP